MSERHEDDDPAVFAGTAPVDDTTVPNWYRERQNARHGTVEFPALSDILAELSAEYGAETDTVYYHDDERGEYVEIPHRRAVVNPAWTGDGLDDAPKNNAAWTTASDSYEAVTAADAYGPLRDAAQARGLRDMYGSVEVYRLGGEVSVEVLFPDLTFEVRGTGREFVLGFESGFDHFKRSSVWASLLAYDTETGAALRGLSERYSRSHRGEQVADELTAWFETMLDRVETLDDTLTQAVAEAREYEIPLYELPLDAAEFYDRLGFPSTWGETAAERLPNTRKPSAFDAYLAIGETIADEFDGKRGGSAVRGHASTANDILFSPPSAERAALVDKHEELAEKNQQTLGGNEAAEGLADRIETLDDGVDAFETMREQFRTILREAGESDEGDEQGGETDAESEPSEVDA